MSGNVEGIWFKARIEGLISQWHRPTGLDRGRVVVGCGSTFGSEVDREERHADRIPANERCPDCQGEYIRSRPAS
jgi:hypothetical protein